jgi:hypothetical protein
VALKKSPRAALIKPRIDAIDSALADAKSKDQAHAGPAALAALRVANDLLTTAKKADADRERHDTRAGLLGKRIDKTADAAEKTALAAMAEDAKKQADALKFADAAKALDRIEVRLDKGQLEALMKAAKPDAKALARLAAKMVGQGGAATVDKMIPRHPRRQRPGGDECPRRGPATGVKFKTGKPLPAVAATGTTPPSLRATPVKAMREVCDMFAKIPEDIVKSPSIKGVEYSDAIGSAGGSFSYDDAKVRMEGRPGIRQQFGSAQKAMDPKTGTAVDQLPAAIDPDCQPADTVAVEYLGFAAAHEVAHAIDDARASWRAKGISRSTAAGPRTAPAYSRSRMPSAPIRAMPPSTRPPSRAVRPRQAPEQARHRPGCGAGLGGGRRPDRLRRMARDRHLGERLPAPERLRRPQAGRHVYHEAYSRVWVRYLFAARSKALTGYQFRAPGEWFSSSTPAIARAS